MRFSVVCILPLAASDSRLFFGTTARVPSTTGQGSLGAPGYAVAQGVHFQDPQGWVYAQDVQSLRLPPQLATRLAPEPYRVVRPSAGHESSQHIGLLVGCATFFLATLRPTRPRVALAAVEGTATAASGTWDLSQLKSRLAMLAVSLARTAWAIRLLAKFLPKKISLTLTGVFESYINAMTKSVGDRKLATALAVRTYRNMMMSYAIQMGEKYEFPSYHKAIKEPFNYDDLSKDYFGKLINYKNSRVRWPERWEAIKDQLSRGENVVLLANHQSEADACFIPLLTETTYPGLGDGVIYVAGDRVVEDYLAKPFSMGRNLLCVYSKKHINSIPALRSIKMRKNIATIKEMERLFKEGGHIIWIAPAGGRDRPDDAGALLPDAWDPDSVELLRKVSSKAGAKPTHFYPLAMATAKVLPPPASVGGAIGEVRSVDYCGIGLSLAEEVDVSEDSAAYAGIDVTDDGARKAALAKFAYDKVVEEYLAIETCMTDAVAEISHSFSPSPPAYLVH